MERLRSNVRERSHELADEVHETALSDSLSSKEYHKREADLVGNFYSSVITQTREAAEAVTGESKPKQSSATSQPEPAPQPRPEVNPSSGQKPEKEQPESPTKGKSRGEGQGNAKLTQEKAEDAPNPADEKDWGNIENRRAVVRRLTMLGDAESAVVEEAMAKSVYREYSLASLAFFESDGKASPSLAKRQHELYDDLKLARDKFSDSDTSTIFKVISNLSYEQMDELDKLVDEVAILAEKNPQGMKRLRDDVTERRNKLTKEVDEIRFSDSLNLNLEEQLKREADLAGNFHSSIIAQTREAAEAVAREPKPKRPSVKSQSEPTSQPSSEADPQSKQKPKQESK